MPKFRIDFAGGWCYTASMEIKTALDFPKLEIELQGLINKLPRQQYRYDGMKVLRNMSKMVTELSKRELTMRRTAGHPTRAVDDQLTLINGEINNLEQWITMLMLS